MAGIGKYEGVGNFEMEAPTPSPAQYAPFKMKASGHNNSPMLKNFGIGGTSPNKFWGAIKSVFNKATKTPEATAEPINAAQTAAANAVGTGAVDPTADPEMAAAENAAAGGGGGVAPHGPEAHLTAGGKPMARAGGMGNIARPVVGGGSGMLNPFSDIRLKEKIQRTGTSSSGIPIYEFNYIGGEARYSGTMAQDLLEMKIDAVSTGEDGYYRVNYNNIDVDMHQLN